MQHQLDKNLQREQVLAMLHSRSQKLRLKSWLTVLLMTPSLGNPWVALRLQYVRLDSLDPPSLRLRHFY
jgi:hypothetical protein